MIISSRFAIALSMMLGIACHPSKNKPKSTENPPIIVDESKTKTPDDEKTPSDLPLNCRAAPICSQDLPLLPLAKGFSNLRNKSIAALGTALHRGRDLVTIAGKPIWIQAKFTYGLLDADLKQEPIDIYLSQGCNSPFLKIGQAITTVDDQHETIDGVIDSGGRIYSELSTLGVESLPIGRHRILLVVPADNSSTELYIDVIDPSSSIVVSDIDGTLTSSELAAASDLLGVSPEAHPGASAALNELFDKGYHILYLTARSEWFMEKTRTWLNSQKFPAGTIITTQSKVGATGSAASQFKVHELAIMHEHTEITPSFAFGNKTSDVAAFGTSGIPAENSYYYELEGDSKGGLIHADYEALKESFTALPKVCVE